MSDTRIAAVHARRIWDSRGRPTLEAEVRLGCGAVGRGIAPAGASRGRFESVELRDGGTRFGGADVQNALRRVHGDIARALLGLDAMDQAAIDRRLIELDGTPDKSNLGGNATVAVSLAALHAAASATAMPLWRRLAGERDVLLPVPEIQIFGGGAHAARRTDVQDFLIMSPQAASFSAALETAAEIYRHAGRLMDQAGLLAGTADEGGWWPNFRSNEQALDMLMAAIEAAGFVPGEDAFIALDVAASEFYSDGVYSLGLDGRQVDSDGLLELLVDWVDRYPILSIEDPCGQDDVPGWQQFTTALGDRLQIVGDDALVTRPLRIATAVEEHWCNASLIKVNQVGTVSEALDALRLCKDAAWGTIVSARSGETEDTTIAHLAVGWDAGQIKVGSFARSERMAKWNELLRIEEQLGAKARYAGWTGLPNLRHRCA